MKTKGIMIEIIHKYFPRLFRKIVKKQFIKDNPHMITKQGVHFYYWNDTPNFGDYINVPIYSHFLKNIVDSKKKKDIVVLGVGSVIQISNFDSVIWGSGFLEKKSDEKIKNRNIKLDIRLIRGPLTGEKLTQLGFRPPKLYGDPALLMPLLYKPQIQDLKEKRLIISHFWDFDFFNSHSKNIKIVNAGTNDYEKIINCIYNSEVVISTSLHGIILSEAYGVPAIYLKINKKIDDFKFRDYYYSTNRFDIKIAFSIEEALKMDPMPLPENLKNLQDNIINTFPYDLFKK